MFGMFCARVFKYMKQLSVQLSLAKCNNIGPSLSFVTLRLIIKKSLVQDLEIQTFNLQLLCSWISLNLEACHLASEPCAIQFQTFS